MIYYIYIIINQLIIEQYPFVQNQNHNLQSLLSSNLISSSNSYQSQHYQIHIQPHVADAPIHRPSSNPAQI